MEQIYIPKQDYKVLVRCFTYNQSKYIEDALNGFAMQQTEFPFVCLVMDDCSTDGEQEVIKAWMERECDMVKAEYIDIELSNVIIVPHKSNTSCTFAFYFLKQNLYGSGKKKMNMVYPWRECCKYEAICEGDDYWIDELKLMQQVCFLDNNDDYIMCYSKAKEFYQATSSFGPIIGSECSNFEKFISKDSIVTLTVLYRVSAYNAYSNNIKPSSKWKMGDLPMWAYFYLQGKIGFLNSCTGVYRVLEKSLSHANSLKDTLAFIHSSADIRKFFIEYSKRSELIPIWKRTYLRHIVSTYHKFKMPVVFADVQPYLCLDIKSIFTYLYCLHYFYRHYSIK